MTMTPDGGKAKPIANSTNKSVKIRALNDKFRKTMKGTDVYLSLEVASSVGDAALKHLLTSIRTYSNFIQKYDPNGDHSAGTVEVGRHRVEWSIDYWDKAEENDSPDPANEALTTRIMTITRA